MIYGIRKIVRYALGTDVAGRNFAVRPGDTFLVSYPRSGNTWIRFLVANLVHPRETVSFTNIERLIPDCEAHSSRYLKRTPAPRIIKSHEYFDHRYKKVIYIVRDPRGVALSYYNFQRKYRQIKDDYPLADYISDFVGGRISSADWGTWGQNVGSWLVREAGPGFLLIRYEDMLADPTQGLADIATFLNLKASAETMATAIERSAAGRMRELERTQSADWVATKDRRQDIPFVGDASAAGWRNRLPSEAVAEIESAWGSLMTRLGYALASHPNDVAGTTLDRSAPEKSAGQMPARQRDCSGTTIEQETMR
jgi:hypothetical protein